MSLILEKYRKNLPRFVLTAELRVESGERVALLGPSGSGKTTLLRFLAGLDFETEGQLWLQNTDGQKLDFTKVPAQKRNFGVCFQSPALFTSLTVLENVAVGLEARKVPKSERQRRAREWLERAQMLPIANQRVEQLSGGEAQRIALLRVLAIEPRVLLLDEPFSSLDAAMRSDARQWVLQLTQDLKIPLLFVTHDRADVDALATRVLEIQEVTSVGASKSERRVVASHSP